MIPLGTEDVIFLVIPYLNVKSSTISDTLVLPLYAVSLEFATEICEPTLSLCGYFVFPVARFVVKSSI